MPKYHRWGLLIHWPILRPIDLQEYQKDQPETIQNTILTI